MALPHRIADNVVNDNFDNLDLRLVRFEGNVTGTTFPTNPADGQTFIYNADTTNGVKWEFQYRAASASTYKWESIGGAPMVSVVDADETFTDDAAYHDTATAGPTVTVPLPGDYLYVASANLYHATGATDMEIGVKPGAAGVAAPHRAQVRIAGATVPVTVTFSNQFLGLAASTALKLQYLSAAAAGAANTRWRSLSVVPIRV